MLRTFSRLSFAAATVCLAAMSLSACADADSGTPPDDDALSPTETGTLALTTDIVGDSDVAGFEFELTPVDCATGSATGEPTTTSGLVDLEDMLLDQIDDGVAGFEVGSDHVFADHFMNVAAGCYDVTARPRDARGGASADCAVARALSVEVHDGATTEILLVSQCAGDERGGLDGVAALNHPPVITALTYSPSKFVYECEWTTVCATVDDPDGDPLRFEWAKVGGPLLTHDGLTVSSTTHNADGTVTECLELAGAQLGDYDLELMVYDTMRDGNGDVVDIESWLQQTDPGATSHDTSAFPLHVRPDVDAFCYNPDSDDFERLPDARVPDFSYHGCYPWGPEMFYCMPEHANTAVTCPDGEFDPSTVFDVCAGHEPEPEPEPCTDLSPQELRQAITCAVDGGEVTFTIPDGICAQEVSFSTYDLSANGGLIHPFDGQVLHDTVTGTFGPGTHTLNATLPPMCGYQADLYTGTTLYDLDPGNGHGSRILCWDLEEDDTCQSGD